MFIKIILSVSYFITVMLKELVQEMVFMKIFEPTFAIDLVLYMHLLQLS